MKVLSFCHNSRDSFPLPVFTIFFLTYYVHKMDSAQFTVIGPRDPVTAVLGQEAVLLCHLSPHMSAANMEVRWFRSEFVSFVHLYHDGKDQYKGQMPEYQGRTELLKAGFTDGNIHLRILNIRRSDEGQYHCFVQDDIDYQEAIVELRVAALGSVPLLSVEGHHDGGIRVVCRSVGWYPEPEVLWRDLSGQHLPSLSETTSRGNNGLFETETALIVTKHSNQNLSCCIRNTILNQEKESAVYIADSFFPRVNPWMVALSVVLLVLFGFIGLTVYLCKMKANVTPDPHTANPDLILSEDQKHVRWTDTEQDLPDNPEGFDSVPGHEEIISREHCKIEMGEDGQYRMKVKQYVIRKGRMNPDGGSGLWRNQFQALTSSWDPPAPETPLSPQDLPCL